MKKILLILPLVFWLGCEEEEEEFFVDAWVECKNVSVKITDAEGNIIQDIYNDWSEKSTVFYDFGEAMKYLEFNDYGILTYSERYYNGRKDYYEIFDKWKVLISTGTDSLGDTLSYVEFSWDELTQESSSINSNNDLIICTVKYNEYGKQLDTYCTNTNSGDILWRQTHEFLEDGRRLDNNQVNNWHTEYEWDINSFEALQFYDGQLRYKLVGEINEYYKETWLDVYEYIDDSWVLSSTSESEWICPGFYQID